MQPRTAEPLPTKARDAAARILENIRSGAWGPGVALPSEAEFARSLGVSLITVKHAYSELASRGILVRRPGRGTFVHRFEQHDGCDPRIRRFESDLGGDPVLLDRLVAVETVPARGALSAWFNPQEPLLHVRAEHWFEDSRVVQCFDDIYVLRRILPQLAADDARAFIVNTYAFYERRCSLTVIDFDEIARAVLLNEEQAARAGVRTPYPAVRVERLAYSIDAVLVEARFRTLLTDTQHLRLASPSNPRVSIRVIP